MRINTVVVALGLGAVFIVALAGGFLVGELLLKPDMPAAEPSVVAQPAPRTLSTPTPVPAATPTIPAKPADIGTEVIRPKPAAQPATPRPAPTPRPTTPPAGAEGPPPPGVLYRVQAGAFVRQDNAEERAAQLREAGFEAYVMRVGPLFKVQVGAFADRENAERLAERLRAVGYPALIVRQ